MKIALIGYGKMGKKVEEIGVKLGYTIVGRIERSGEGLESLKRADVAIDFSTPDDPLSHFNAVLTQGVPVVIGSTGWDASFDAVKKRVDEERLAVVVGANFSIGVALFREVVKRGREVTLRAGGYEVGGIEIHHSAKRDAPSGTAHTLSRDLRLKEGEEPIPFASLRVGSVMGSHQIVFDSAEDTLEVRHVAKDRSGFARGALLAAKWLSGKKGFFTFDDVVREEYVCNLMV